MPKVVTTAAKGLVQSTGAGFKQLDFMMGYSGNLSTATIAKAAISAAAVGTPTPAQVIAASLATNTITTTDYVGSGAAGSLFLPAAYAGTHVAVKFSTTPAGSNDVIVFASHGTAAYNSASELARQNAGGSRAVFRAVRVGGSGTGAGLNHGISDDADTKMTIDVHGTNCSHDAAGEYHFYCIEDGVWTVAVHAAQKGTGSLLAFGND